MRKLLLSLILFIPVAGLAQPRDTIKENPAEQKLINADSVFARIEKMKRVNDSLLKALPAPDSNTIKENFDRNITGLLELQKKQRAKEKRGAMIRIGIGIALLIVLIIGLRRKTVKKQG